jgi:hypothetical protein
MRHCSFNETVHILTCIASTSRAQAKWVDGKAARHTDIIIWNVTNAVVGLATATQIFVEGLEALPVHCQNCTDEGPKYLQLLWRDFFPEHWEDLWKGSS